MSPANDNRLVAMTDTVVLPDGRIGVVTGLIDPTKAIVAVGGGTRVVCQRRKARLYV